MIKDGIFKTACTFLVAWWFTMQAKLICCPQMSAGILLLTFAGVALLSFIFICGIVQLVARLRLLKQLQHNFWLKISVLATVAITTGFATSFTAAYSLLWLTDITIPGAALFSIGKFFGALCLLLVLLYEALFLSKERDIDIKVANQLDHERAHASIAALKSGLDPHFIFNALTTVAYLVRGEPETAQQFTQKLAQVYKYFLINKDCDLVALQEELRFIDAYFFLLKIRYRQSVQFHLQVQPLSHHTRIIPCSLQLLVENAIKHNSFSETRPLHISIYVNDKQVTVQNELHPLPYAVESTRIGLLYLKQHYRLLGKQEIAVEQNEHYFKVQLPLIKPN
jgi:two-component system, LytTR family, sensor kinase